VWIRAHHIGLVKLLLCVNPLYFNSYVTWLIYICAVTHVYVCTTTHSYVTCQFRGVNTCSWFQFICAVTHLYICSATHSHVSCLFNVSKRAHHIDLVRLLLRVKRVCRDSIILHVLWLNHIVCAMTQSQCTCRDWIICATTHSYMTCVFHV